MLVTIHRCSEIQEVEEVGGVVPELNCLTLLDILENE